MNNKQKIIIGIGIGIFIIVGMIFYWYSYRPSSIVSKCSFEAKEQAIEKGKRDNDVLSGTFKAEDRDAYYKWCLQEKGLIK